MSLDKAMKKLKYDKRLTEWSINNGEMTKEEYEAYLKTLPDMAHNIDLSDSDKDENTQEH